MACLQSLDKALDLFIEFKFCESDFYFLNGSKNCMVATYNFGSVYICIYVYGLGSDHRRRKNISRRNNSGKIQKIRASLCLVPTILGSL